MDAESVGAVTEHNERGQHSTQSRHPDGSAGSIPCWSTTNPARRRIPRHCPATACSGAPVSVGHAPHTRVRASHTRTPGQSKSRAAVVAVAVTAQPTTTTTIMIAKTTAARAVLVAAEHISINWGNAAAQCPTLQLPTISSLFEPRHVEGRNGP